MTQEMTDSTVMEELPDTKPENMRRVAIALVLGYVSGLLVVVVYSIVALMVFSRGNLLGEVFQNFLRLVTVSSFVLGLASFLAARGYQCQEENLEERRKLALQLGILDTLLTVWFIIGWAAAWLVLPLSD